MVDETEEEIEERNERMNNSVGNDPEEPEEINIEEYVERLRKQGMPEALIKLQEAALRRSQEERKKAKAKGKKEEVKAKKVSEKKESEKKVMTKEHIETLRAAGVAEEAIQAAIDGEFYISLPIGQPITVPGRVIAEKPEEISDIETKEEQIERLKRFLADIRETDPEAAKAIEEDIKKLEEEEEKAKPKRVKPKPTPPGRVPPIPLPPPEGEPPIRGIEYEIEIESEEALDTMPLCVFNGSRDKVIIQKHCHQKNVET